MKSLLTYLRVEGQRNMWTRRGRAFFTLLNHGISPVPLALTLTLNYWPWPPTHSCCIVLWRCVAKTFMITEGLSTDVTNDHWSWNSQAFYSCLYLSERERVARLAY